MPGSLNEGYMPAGSSGVAWSLRVSVNDYFRVSVR